jgi:hypothetical protein
MVKKFSVEYIWLFLFEDSSARDIDKFRQEVLAQHNTVRAEQCANPLQSNTTLDKIAQNWCNRIATTGQLVHSNTTDYGENSFQKIPSDPKDNGILLIWNDNEKYLFIYFRCNTSYILV